MRNYFKIIFIGSIFALIPILLGIIDSSTKLIAAGFICEAFFIMIIILLEILYRITLKKKRIISFENEYELCVLNKDMLDKFVIKKSLSNTVLYIFSYFDTNIKTIARNNQVVNIKKLDKPKPYVRKYKITFESIKFLDYIFGSILFKETLENSFLYELYIDENLHLEEL